ncbi:MAG: aminodeoxychorismate synthase, partial [Monoraphidium minutum]
MKALLIDNYDSYTFNLYQIVCDVAQEEPLVYHNDAITIEGIKRLIADGAVDSIILSPGPGSPLVPADVGVCMDVLRQLPAIPILGVCLGHQALAAAHGAAVARAPEPVHGRLSALRHGGHALFAGCPSGPGAGFDVVRYHSLVVDPASLPPQLVALAWTCAGHHASAAGGGGGGGGAPVLMALAHRDLPHYGVQFHPESVATRFGVQLLANFRDLVAAHYGRGVPAAVEGGLGPPGRCLPPRPWPPAEWEAGALFEALAGPGGGEDAFWLDSSSTERARFSFMGCRGGPLWRRVHTRPQPRPGVLTAVSSDGCASSGGGGDGDPSGLRAAAAALPFDFWGGFAGYLGYELKAECGGDAAHAAAAPDAGWFFADRLVAVDHKPEGGGGSAGASGPGDVYLLALYDYGAAAGCSSGGGGGQGAAAADGLTFANGAGAAAPPPPPPAFALRDARARYVRNVASCQAALHAGESYELCLTTALAAAPGARLPDAWAFYSTLRAVNPAPYAAWLRFGGPQGGGGCGEPDPDGLTLCCSSPERFLRCGRGGVLEARPIKGTARRCPGDAAADAALAAALAACEKERAENLMIVDLLRNDLGRVCEPGSVHVPGLIELESYATVHQLVSTVRGLRRPGVSGVAAARAAFPGGSMTGAPKVRSMAILDALEAAPRGPYSGCLGFFSVGDAFDLNIVIRTAVFTGGGVSIGAGGAVVVQSEPAAEYEEMRLKAAALLRAAGL